MTKLIDEYEVRSRTLDQLLRGVLTLIPYYTEGLPLVYLEDNSLAFKAPELEISIQDYEKLESLGWYKSWDNSQWIFNEQ